MSPRAKSAAAIGLIAVLLAVFAVNAYLAALDKCATVDEPANLVGGWIQTHLHDYRFNCEDPALFNLFVGVGLQPNLFHADRQSPQWQSLLINTDERAPIASAMLYNTPTVDADSVLRLARLRMLGVALAMGVAVAFIAWRLAGHAAAVFAVAVFAFDPNFLAHSPLVKNDMLFATCLLLTTIFVWTFAQRGTFWRFAGICLCAAMAFTVKFSGVLVVPMLALALLLLATSRRSWKVGPFLAHRPIERLALSCTLWTIVVLFIWLSTWICYDFRFLPTPQSSDQFEFAYSVRYFANHQAYAQSAHPLQLTPADLEDFWRNWNPPLSVRLVLFANAHHLLPQSFLAGFLRIDAGAQSRVAFLCGKSSVTGWWYYFPIIFVFKTPIATLLGSLGAAIVLTVRLPRIAFADLWKAGAALVFPVFYFAVAMHSNTNVGVRHILPVYPFLFVAIGVAGAIAWHSSRRAIRLVPIVLLIALITESAAAFPNYIPFFNAFCGGSRGGFHLLSESNLDWGQDLPALARWQSQHPDRPIYLLYWGSVPPGYYGIHYVNLPESTAPPDLPMPGPGRPVYAISAVVLTNPFTRMREKELFDYLDRHSPIEIINGSIYIYDAP